MHQEMLSMPIPMKSKMVAMHSCSHGKTQILELPEGCTAMMKGVDDAPSHLFRGLPNSQKSDSQKVMKFLKTFFYKTFKILKNSTD